MMKIQYTILLLLISLSSQISIAQKNEKWLYIQGQLVDTLGQEVKNERVALINQKGNDEKIVVTDKEGNFSFKVKKKNIENYSIKCYSQFVNTERILLSNFLAKGKLVLNFDCKKNLPYCGATYCPAVWIRDLDKMPFNYETNEMVRFLPGVK